MRALPFILVAALAVLYLMVSNQDYKDQKADEAHYCKMVHQRAWPDFKEIYNQVCNAKYGRIGSHK